MIMIILAFINILSLYVFAVMWPGHYLCFFLLKVLRNENNNVSIDQRIKKKLPENFINVRSITPAYWHTRRPV